MTTSVKTVQLATSRLNENANWNGTDGTNMQESMLDDEDHTVNKVNKVEEF